MRRGMFFGIIVALAFSALAPRFARAQALGPITIQPAYPREENERTKHIFVHEVIAETFLQEGVTVINGGMNPQRVRVYATDYQPSNSGGFSCEQYVDTDDDVGAWLNVEKEEIVVQPGSIELVPFTIRVPRSVGAGEHNACIVSEVVFDKEGLSSEGGISVTTRSAIRVALLVPGDIVKEVGIKEFEVEKEDDKVLFVSTLVNDGSVSADVDISIQTRPILGIGFTKTEGTFAILRDTTREFRMELVEPPFWGGWHEAALFVQYDPNPVMVGLRDEDRFVAVTAQSSYFFLAPSPIAIGILAVGIIVVLIFAVGRLLVFRRQRRAALSWASYRAIKGDNIKNIAEKHCVSWRILARVNDIKAPYTIKEGFSVKVPSKKNIKETQHDV